jgi:flagellar biosynthetic protein FlhB
VVFSAQPLKPDFTRMNPAAGLKRLFTPRLLLETLKNIVKLAAYGTVGYLLVTHSLRGEGASIHDAASLLAAIWHATLKLLAAFAGVALLFAGLDQIIARRDFLKKMRMSRRDVRRESREREGDPRLKQRRKQLHAEFSKHSQSMRNLKGADVLITNPEHIALGLRYDRRAMQAPTVVSIGIDRQAQKLKRMALLFGVPVIENRPLARALYSRSALNRQIPEHCFQAVADIYNALRRRNEQNAGAHA